MNDDDRLRRHLTEQADAISLRPADPVAAARRGVERRNRRRGALVGVTAIAVAAASVAIVDRGDPDATVDSGLAAAIVASPLDWTVVDVDPDAGLGYSRATVAAGGAVYSLSTAPGPQDQSPSYEPHLYRSDDGTDWAEVSLPSEARTSSLAASGDTLYAIGTAPAGGGGRELVVSTSTDGAESWTSVTLPADLAALEARHPGEVVISQPTIAARDATHVVASVVVTASPDVMALLPDADPDAGWEVTSEGVTIYSSEPCAEDEGCTVSPPAPSTTVVEGEADPEAARAAGGEPGDGSPKVAGTYTWDELGLDPELRSLIPGKTFVFATDDGVTFEPASLPGGAAGWGGHLLATDDGYRLFIGRAGAISSSTQVLRSEDGLRWAEGETLEGSPQSAGILGGRPAVATYQEAGLDVLVEQSDGSWAALDVRSAVDGVPEDALHDVAFGPMGLAAVVWDASVERYHVVHSADGSTLSAVAVPDDVATSTAFIGLSVSADAILMRLGELADTDPSTVPAQQVLVGTPRR